VAPYTGGRLVFVDGTGSLVLVTGGSEVAVGGGGGGGGGVVAVVSVLNTPPVRVEAGGGPVSVVVTDPSVLVGCMVSSAIGFPNWSIVIIGINGCGE
jgi:hypothetical protein